MKKVFSGLVASIVLLFCFESFSSTPKMSTDKTSISGVDVLTKKVVEIDLAKTKKATVLLFLSSVCPCTNNAIEQIKALSKNEIKEGYDFYGINLDYKATEKSLEEYYRALGFSFPIIRDVDLKIARSFGVTMMAESVVVSPKGMFLYRGGIRTEKDEMILFDALKKISAGLELTSKVGEGMGCFLRYPDAKKE
jgi:peroxiredoxin